MKTQLDRGLAQRLLYVGNKDGLIDGARARIGWAGFSRSGRSVLYRGRTLLKARGVRGNFLDVETGEEYWVSGVKRRGSNPHPAEAGIAIEIDPDALEAYRALRADAG